MKGVELFSDIIMMFVIVAVAALMGGYVITAKTFYSGKHATEINIATLYNPIKYDLYFLAFLESTESHRIPMKRILTYAAFEETKDVYVDNYILDAAKVSKELTEQMIVEPYYLKLITKSGKTIDLAGDSKSLQNPKVFSTILFLPDYSTGGLELYVG